MFKTIRIIILLALLLAVAASAAWQRWRMHAWTSPQIVTLYPINADGAAATEQYLQELRAADFQPLAQRLNEEAARHGLALAQPLRVALGGQAQSRPPDAPQQDGALAAMRWSLALRWWAWRHTPPSSPIPDVKLYLLFHSDAQLLPHSVGLQQGRLGIAHVFASPAQAGSNLVVIAHELLHTFGASDKYDPATLQPLLPEGYADAAAQPLLPQAQAELMAGRIPVGASELRMPRDLNETMVGEATAREIGWSGKP